MLEVLRELRKRFRQKRPALFKSGQLHFHQDNDIQPTTPSLSLDYLTKMGIKTLPHHPYSLDLAPCDLWLFPKLTGCRYEISEEMKEAVTKVIDMLTQEVLPWGLPEVVGTVQEAHCSRRTITSKGTTNFMCVRSIKVPIRKKSGNLFNDPRKSKSKTLFSMKKY